MGWYGQFNVPGQVQVSDNVNGTWVRSSATESFQGTGDIALEYVQNSKAAPSGITITVTIPAGPSAYLQEVVAQFRGVSTTNALDQFAVAESNQGTAISAGPTAAVAAGDLVIGAVITGGQPGNITAGSSDSVPYINDVVDAQNGSASSDLEDILSSAAGPQTANATLGVGGDWYMVVATFRPAPTTFTLSGIVRASDGTPLNGTQVYVFDAHDGRLHRGGHDGRRRDLHDRPPRGQLQALHRAQHPGLRRPVVGGVELRERHRDHGQRPPPPRTSPWSAPRCHPVGHRQGERRDPPQWDPGVRLRRARRTPTSGPPRWAPAGPTRSPSPRAATSSTSSPTPRATPTSGWGGRTTRAPP